MRYYKGRWYYRGREYDTLEEAQAALDREQAAFAGRYRYRIVEPWPAIDYRPVPQPPRGWWADEG